MSKANPKVFLARRRQNLISHRPISAYERRNQHLLAMTYTVHQTRESALAQLVLDRKAELAAAEKEVARAKRGLAKAQEMMKSAG